MNQKLNSQILENEKKEPKSNGVLNFPFEKLDKNYHKKTGFYIIAQGVNYVSAQNNYISAQNNQFLEIEAYKFSIMTRSALLNQTYQNARTRLQHDESSISELL